MYKKEILKNIKKAKGDLESELVFKNANIINVFSGEITRGNLAVDNGVIIGVGDYKGKEEIDLKGKYIAPGFVDSHVHIESSMSSPSEFAKIIVPRGVTTIIADPHEIANVKGLDGIKYIIEESRDIPLDVYIMLPSCVPATDFENSGVVLEAEDLKTLIEEDSVLGLGELMNYPGVIDGDGKILDKLALFKNHIIDGHGPLISDLDLNTYVIAGVKTEHECSTVEEVIDRLRRGMYILLREGSAARDLRNTIQAVNKDNLRRFMFCTDDKHPEDLIYEGSIDFNIKLAIESGIDPVDAIKMASLNSCECYGLKDRGAVAPGYRADLVIIDNLDDFNILNVYKDGKLVGENGKALFDSRENSPAHMIDTVNIKKVNIDDLDIKMNSNKANVISVIENSLVTEKNIREVELKNGHFKFSDNGILKLVVVERHKKTGNIGLGLIENFNIKNGAIGSTIGHDSHNLIVLGDNDRDILMAINELETMGGGITLVSNGKVEESLKLEIGGIMTSKPAKNTIKTLKTMMDLAYNELGVNKDIDPFMTLSFMALPVIPKLKLTDKGLFDVEKFKFIEIEVKEE